MKTLKTVLAVIGTLFVLFFIWVALSPDEDTTNPENYEGNSEGYAESPDYQASADDFYGNNTEPGCNAETGQSTTNNSATGKVKHITSDEFCNLVADFNTNKDRYIGNGPCIVDFYATWCGPCKALSPVLDRMAKKYKGKVTIYKVDIDQEPAVSNAYNIESIPTLLLCSDGQIEMMSGAPDEDTLDEMMSMMQ